MPEFKPDTVTNETGPVEGAGEVVGQYGISDAEAAAVTDTVEEVVQEQGPPAAAAGDIGDEVPGELEEADAASTGTSRPREAATAGRSRSAEKGQEDSEDAGELDTASHGIAKDRVEGAADGDEADNMAAARQEVAAALADDDAEAASEPEDDKHPAGEQNDATEDDAADAGIGKPEGEAAHDEHSETEAEDAESEDADAGKPSRTAMTAEQEADYEAWVRSESGALLSSLGRKFGYDRAPDLLQEGLTRAYQKWHMFEDGTNRAAWLRTVVTNAAVTEVRKDASRPKEAVLSEEEHDSAVSSAPSHDMHPDDVVGMQDVNRALGALAPEFRDVVVANAEGYSYKEIADQQGTPIGTVQSRLSRARAQMRATLNGSGEDTKQLSAAGSGEEPTSTSRQNGASVDEQVDAYAQRRIAELRSSEPGITVSGIAKALGITTREVRRYQLAKNGASADRR